MAGGSANLTEKQRSKLPDSAFCGYNRTFPVTAASDIDNAVSNLGHASSDQERADIKACIIKKAKQFGWIKSLPQNWQDALAGKNS